MASWPIIDHNFFAGWANLMIRALCQGSLAILFIWILIRLFPRIHPAIQCWLWRLVCLKVLIALFWVEPLKLYFHLQIGLRQLVWLLANSPQPSRQLAKLSQSLLKTASPLPVIDGIELWFLFWLTGLSIFIAGFFYFEFRRQKSSYNFVPITDPTIIGLYQELGRHNKFRKIPRLFTADGISNPLLQGIIHPKIIIPASMVTNFSNDELRLILAHELAHYKRGDLFWNWLTVLTRTIFFFLPYIWWVEKKLVQLQEICCDRLAVQYTNTPAANFGKILLQVSLRQGLPQKISPYTHASIGFASQSLELLKNRLKALRSVNQLNRKRMTISTVILLILGVTTVIPWELVHAQPLPVNLVISCFSRDRLELSARVMLPKKEIKTITALIDGKQLSTTYNANGIYLGFARATEDNFPLAGLHQAIIKVQTTTGVMMDQHWIYFHDSMIWSSQNLGLESNKTVIKIGPFFWVINNRTMFLSSLL